MSALEGFKAFDFSEGVPYASVTNNGLNFNKSVVLKLGCPRFVRLLINDESKQIAVQKCDENDEHAMEFYKDRKSNIKSVRWNTKDLLNTLSQMMNWDLKEKGYRIEGTLLRDENAMIFDLNNASVLN